MIQIELKLRSSVQKFFVKLFLTPPLWISIVPGLLLVFLGNRCWSYPNEILDTFCQAVIFGRKNFDLAILFLDALLYAALRGYSIKTALVSTQGVAWISEIFLLIVGEFLVLLIVVIGAIGAMNGI